MVPSLTQPRKHTSLLTPFSFSFVFTKRCYSTHIYSLEHNVDDQKCLPLFAAKSFTGIPVLTSHRTEQPPWLTCGRRKASQNAINTQTNMLSHTYFLLYSLPFNRCINVHASSFWYLNTDLAKLCHKRKGYIKCLTYKCQDQ